MPSATRVDSGALERVAALAARITGAPIAAVFVWEGAAPKLAASFGPVAAWETALERTARRIRAGDGCDTSHQEPVKARWIRGWNGESLGALLVVCPSPRQPAALHASDALLADVTALAADAIELERRQTHGPGQERRKTQEQLLGKTLELAKFGEDLRQLHRLGTTDYGSLEEMFADYLTTGRAIFGLDSGVIMRIRGGYATISATQSDGHSPRTGMTFDVNRVLCGLVAERQATIACPSVERRPELAERPHYGPYRPGSYIGAPILLEDELYGVLSFCSPRVRWREFSLHEIELIELMAQGIARAVLEARMMTQRSRAEQLEKDRSRVLEMVAKGEPLPAVLDQIVHLVERQCPALTGAFHLLREGRLDCAAAPGLPASYRNRYQNEPPGRAEGCALRAAATRFTEILTPEPPRCGHEHCWQACGSAAVLSGSGEVLGLLAVYWRVAVQPRQAQVEILEMACALAAIAIEHRRIAERLNHHANHDVLTGAPNRGQLAASIERRITKSPGKSFSVAFIDLDRFKQINDLWGHAAGDAVLVETARRLRACLRPDEMVARVGGDEFVALLDAPDPEEGMARGRQLLSALRAPILWQGEELLVTASIGVSQYPGCGEQAGQLLARADTAMYSVKNSGKNDLRCFSPDPADRLRGRLEVEHALRRAIERGEMALRLQPIWVLGAGVQEPALDAMEVLLRWEHPALGRVSPGDFIPIAEECGQIAGIGEWVLGEACREAMRWQQAGRRDVRVCVNVSPLQFARVGFVEMVERELRASGLSGQLLELEITESAIMGNAHDAVAKLERLRALGVRIALDDFGTGYSSLSYLRWIPADTLKIDRSFIAGVQASSEALALVQTIVDLAHNLSLEVVAEGIEQSGQLERLRLIRCDKGQGHLFGAPMPVEEARRWLADPAGRFARPVSGSMAS